MLLTLAGTAKLLLIARVALVNSTKEEKVPSRRGDGGDNIDATLHFTYHTVSLGGDFLSDDAVGR